MLNALDDRAPFCPLAIHVDSLCYAMAPAAMYSCRPDGGVRLWFWSVGKWVRTAGVQGRTRKGGVVVESSSEVAYLEDS
jgi:hypothetical protein